MQRERWHGTLELLVGTPPHFALVLLPITLAMSTIGIYSLAATLLYGHFLFGIDLEVVHPLQFAIAILGTVLSFGALGFVFAVTFVRFRAAWALGNLFEYPVWLIGGFLVPLVLLPHWVRPISWVLAPTWGMNAIREAASGGAPLDDLLHVPRARRALPRARHPAHRTERCTRPARTRRSSCRDLPAHLLLRRPDDLPRALLLADAADLRPQPARGADLPDPALRVHRPVGGPRVGQVLRGRQRDPVRGHPLPLRDDADDRRRALPEHAERDPRQPGPPHPAVLRPRSPGRPQRRLRLGVLAHRGRAHPRTSTSRSLRCRGSRS